METRRQGRHPERTIYATTEAGRAEFFDWLRVLIRTPAIEYTQFVAGLALIAHLSPLESVALLEDRMHSLSEKIEEQHSDLETGKQRGVDRLFLIEDEYRLAQLESERGWIGLGPIEWRERTGRLTHPSVAANSIKSITRKGANNIHLPLLYSNRSISEEPKSPVLKMEMGTETAIRIWSNAARNHTIPP